MAAQVPTDRLASLPQELRDIIVDLLIPPALEVKIVSFADPNKAGKKSRVELVAVNGSDFRAAVSLAATSNFLAQQVHSAIKAKTAIFIDLASDPNVTHHLPGQPNPPAIPASIIALPRRISMRDTYFLADTALNTWILFHKFYIQLYDSGPQGAAFWIGTGVHRFQQPVPASVEAKMALAQRETKEPIMTAIVRSTGHFTVRTVQKLAQSSVLDERIVGWEGPDGGSWGRPSTVVLRRKWAKRRVRNTAEFSAMLVMDKGRCMEGEFPRLR